MSKQRTKRVIGNWKMHGRLAGNQALLNEVVQGAGAVAAETSVGVCVPFPYLAQVHAQLDGGRVAWGAQDVSAHEQGAFTGEVAAAMVAEFGARYAIVGHSERRAYHGESNETVAAKTQRALAAGLTVTLASRISPRGQARGSPSTRPHAVWQKHTRTFESRQV